MSPHVYVHLLPPQPGGFRNLPDEDSLSPVSTLIAPKDVDRFADERVPSFVIECVMIDISFKVKM